MSALVVAEKNIKNAVVGMSSRYFDFRMIFVWSIFVIVLTVIIKVDSQNILDTRLYYSNEEAIQYIKSLSRKDTYRYLLTEIFNLILVVTSTVLLYLSLKRFYIKKTKLKYLALVPGALALYEASTLISVLTDQAELKAYPWLGLIALFKWLTLSLVLFLVVLGSAHHFKNKYKTLAASKI